MRPLMAGTGADSMVLRFRTGIRSARMRISVRRMCRQRSLESGGLFGRDQLPRAALASKSWHPPLKILPICRPHPSIGRFSTARRPHQLHRVLLINHTRLQSIKSRNFEEFEMQQPAVQQRDQPVTVKGPEESVKYHGKWPFVRIFSLQEPASVAFSVLNLLVHFQGFSSFLVLVYYKLPSRARGPYYKYVGLWTMYGLLSMNSWIWSTVFHSRDMMFTEMLDYSSTNALIGYSLMLAIIRIGNLRSEALQVMVAAPIIAFITMHILYLNLYKFDYGV